MNNYKQWREYLLVFVKIFLLNPSDHLFLYLLIELVQVKNENEAKTSCY